MTNFFYCDYIRFISSFQRIPLTYDKEKGAWILEKELPVSTSLLN
jgi:hypothetical protein